MFLCYLEIWLCFRDRCIEKMKRDEMIDLYELSDSETWSQFERRSFGLDVFLCFTEIELCFRDGLIEKR